MLLHGIEKLEADSLIVVDDVLRDSPSKAFLIFAVGCTVASYALEVATATA